MARIIGWDVASRGARSRASTAPIRGSWSSGTATAASTVALALSLVTAGCHRWHALDEGTVAHDGRAVVTVSLRDRTVLEGVAVPESSGRVWWVATDDIDPREVISVRDGPAVPGVRAMRRVTVTLRGGVSAPALALTAGRSRRRLLRIEAVPTERIASIRQVRRGPAMVLGAVVGAVALGSLGAVSMDDEPRDDCPDAEGGRPPGCGLAVGVPGVEIVVGLGLLGGLLGGLIGAGMGMRTTYGDRPQPGQSVSWGLTVGDGVLGLSGRF